MKKIFIDTNVYSGAMRGDKNSIDYFQQHEEIWISPIVIGELLYGFKKGNQFHQNQIQMEQFLLQERVVVPSITNETSAFYSYILNVLKMKGTPIPTNDIWIASQVIENGSVLASFDQHFKKVEGLIII